MSSSSLNQPSTHHANSTPIAIVGMDGLFPDSPTLDDFWQNICRKHHASRTPPPKRWLLDADSVYHPERGRADHVYSKQACFLDDAWLNDVSFDGLDAGINQLDPMFRLLLRVGRQVWADAGLPDAVLARTGLIIGNLALPSEKSSALARRFIGRTLEEKLLGADCNHSPMTLDGNNSHVAGLPAAVLAKALGLNGTCFTLDAACASSLYAIKLAMDELRAGRADAMIAGGLSRPDSLYTQMGFSQLQALSASGVPAPFDASGDGLVVGEGCGLFVLKRLADAERDGNTIHAVIHAVGLSNDLAGGLLAPESEGQLRAMLSAYQQAGWSPTDVSMIECHAPGTPVGDVVEFESMRSLWDGCDWQRGQCVIGSVKSNIGHLLTAAGSAALMKTLLAMKHGQLPPTANFTQAAQGIELADSPFHILQQPQPWDTSITQRAAISAFGFGGINAHLLLESYTADNIVDTTTQQPIHCTEEPIAIIGMAAHVGPWDSVERVRQRIYGNDQTAPCPPTRWWGAENSAWFTALGLDPAETHSYGIDEVSAALGAYRIPPHEMAEILPRQLLMLNLAATALQDAGNNAENNTGVFIGTGLDMQATNFSVRWDVANRSEEWLKTLALTMEPSDKKEWINHLRTMISPPLNAGRTMGALGSTVASRIAKAFRTGGPAFTVSAEDQSGLRAIEVGIRALQCGEVNRALVGAVDMHTDIRAFLSRHARRINKTPLPPMADGGGALLLKRLRDAEHDGDRIYAVIQGFGTSFDTETSAQQCGITKNHSETRNTTQLLGDAGAANGMLAMIHGTLVLYHRLQSGKKIQPWFSNRAEGKRQQVVSNHGFDGSYAHALLEEYVNTAAISTPVLMPDVGLFVLAGNTVATLQQQLDLLQTQASTHNGDMHQLAVQQNIAAGTLRLTMVADDASMLLQQIDYARESLRENPSMPIGVHGSITVPKKDVQDRVFYNPKPLAKNGRVAFVFAGSGNHFPQMGRDLFNHWPHIIANQEQSSQWLKQQYLPQSIWSDDLHDLYKNHNALVISHVALGTAISDLLRSFALHPSAAIGYSLGESTSLFSLGAWSDRDTMVQRLHDSPLFTKQLAGACLAARQLWQLKTNEDVDWVIGMISFSADRIRNHLPAYPRAYLLIINTPTECVIGGQRASVMGLVAALDTHFHPLEGVTTVHCEVVSPVADAYRNLHLFETKQPKNIDFYGFYSGEKHAVNRENAADSILDQAMHTVDFPRLIEQAYADGIRLFFEIGPGQSCSRMIHGILGERPHLARSSCYAGESASGLVLRTLAHAIAEGLNPDLSHLYPVASKEKTQRRIAASKAGAPFKPSPLVGQVVVPSQSNTTLPSSDVLMPPSTETHDWTIPLRTVLAAKADAHSKYLDFAATMQDAMVRSLTLAAAMPASETTPAMPVVAEEQSTPSIITPPRSLNRTQCLAFAVGNIGDVLGESFASIDQHPTRVRLPDEPLMLVDRILSIEGEPHSMSHGRVVTEHDVTANRWYLDGGHIPTCVAVEAGQADLFLSAYLGIDFITKGKAVYRLLDAVVTFHGSLPVVGDVIHYDIYIDEFFRQGDTWLFRFHFESMVNGRPLMSMQKGCAGFFTEQALAAGQGIIHTKLDVMQQQGTLPANWMPPLTMVKEQWDDTQISALYAGDLTACFGAPFNTLDFTPYTLPPQVELRLVDRVVSLDPSGGRYRIGQICAEMDIQPDDWFLTCHFIDDQVMPGTLMYECCMHTLRIFLLRMGWVGIEGETWCEPLPHVDSGLKCRGQVLATTKVVTYQVDIKTLGYDPEPFAIVNALMFADGKPIVEITNMSACLRGLTQASVEQLWQQKNVVASAANTRAVLYNTKRITAFAIGKPSEAFGERYTVFDQQRKIARLPGPPFQFLDRIMDVQGEPWVMQTGATVEAAYDVPPDAWYFAANRQASIPFSVLLEIALQPCGWLAAYIGSALTSDIDLSFRNLDGNAIQHRAITPQSGTLSTHVTITKVSSSGGMIIQNYDFEVSDQYGTVYTGNTVFGFFSKASLAQQVGVRGAKCYQATAGELEQAQKFPYPTTAPYPTAKMQMIDTIELFIPDGGTHGLGFIRGTKKVDPEEWFFKAHFYQDPVCPGSLGLESFLQLLKLTALQRWNLTTNTELECMAYGKKHQWNYRGQIIPSNTLVSVEAMITAVDESEQMITADGYLSVDGKTIYQMFGFTVKVS